MQITVGQALVYKGRQFVIMRIDTHSTVCFANCDSETLRSQQQTPENVRHMDMQISEFKESDIIVIEVEVIELTDPGKHIELIYNKFHAKRVNGN